MAMIDNDWLPAVEAEFKKPYYRELYSFVKNEYATHQVFPPAEDIFNAFHFTPLSKVKVLLLGQDPYHNVHQAHGLSFSVPVDQREIPPSLQNIYKELQSDLGCYIPQQRLSEEVGGSGSSFTQYGFDGPGPCGSIPSGKRMGAVYGCRHPSGQRTGSAHCVYAVGTARTVEDPHAYESETFDPEGTASKPAFRIQRLLWL